MCTQLQLDSMRLLQVCEHIFSKGEYVPQTVAELEVLQSFGFEQKGSAVVLPAGIEYLDLDYIEQKLLEEGETLNLKHLRLENCVGSTNQELLKLAATSGIFGTVFLAELQTSGRGRFGRNWYSPVGRNLAVSLGARVSRGPSELGAISLVVGVAVAKAIQELEVDDVALKWPNDILLDNRKVGGILVDLLHATFPFEFVVGIGLNIGGGSVVGEVVDNPIADLLEYSSLPIRNRLVVSIVRNVYDSIRSFESDGFQSFQERWQTLDALRGKAVTISTPTESIRGLARGVHETGELRIELKDGRIHYVIAGEVSLD